MERRHAKKYPYCEKLIAERKKRHMSQENIGRYLGISQTMYARYERGENEMPIHHLIGLCKLFEVSADELLGLSDKKNTK